LGVIITLFMLGMSIAIYGMNKAEKRGWNYLHLCIIIGNIGVYSLILPFILINLNNILSLFQFSKPDKILTYLVFLLSIPIGMVFSMISRLSYKGDVSETSSSIYSSDLIGAGIGSLLVSAILIPLIGITWVCAIVGLMNILSIVFLLPDLRKSTSM
jgi:predicted membrane-bound spermidine synthase